MNVNIMKFNNYFFSYGDVTPVSVGGKSLSIVWIMMGLVLNGMIIGHISSQLSVANSEEPVKMYNAKVK